MSNIGICEYCKYKNTDMMQAPCIGCSAQMGAFEFDLSNHDKQIKADAIEEDMTREELYKKITNIFGNGCLSEDVHKCEFDGVCELHEKVKVLEVVEEYSKQIRADAIEEFVGLIENTYGYDYASDIKPLAEQLGLKECCDNDL